MKNLFKATLVAIMALMFSACSETDDVLVKEESTETHSPEAQFSDGDALNFGPMTWRKLKDNLDPQEEPCEDGRGNCTIEVPVYGSVLNDVVTHINDGTVSNYFASGDAAADGFDVSGAAYDDLVNGNTTLMHLFDIEPAFEGQFVVVYASASSPHDYPSYLD